MTRRLLQTVAWILRLGVVAVLVAAIAGKVADPLATIRTLEGWSIMPPKAAGFLVPLLVGFESFLATSLLIRGGSALVQMLTLFAFVVFSSAVTSEVLTSKSVSCGCFGAVSRVIPDAYWATMVRNGLLIAMLVPGLVFALRKGSSVRRDLIEPVTAHQPDGRGVTERSGMTLIELLVSLAIVAVLIAIFVPTLGVIRSKAKETGVQADLRTLVQAASIYTGDHDGTMPAPAGGPGDDYFFFSQGWRLEWAMEHLSLPTSETRPLMRQTDDGQNSPILYASSVFSAPSFWDGETPRDITMLRSQKQASVVYPSNKAMFIAPLQAGGYQGITVAQQAPDPKPLKVGLTPLGFVDGRAGQFQPDELILPDRRGESPRPWSWYPLPIYGSHTAGGVRGRDVK